MQYAKYNELMNYVHAYTRDFDNKGKKGRIKKQMN